MEQATTSHVSFVLALLILVLAVTSITAFSESKEAEPEDWYAIQRGLRFFASGNYAEAALWFEKALEEHPDHAGIHTVAGRAYDNLGRYKEAADSFRRAVELLPAHLNAQTNLCRAYAKLQLALQHP